MTIRKLFIAASIATTLATTAHATYAADQPAKSFQLFGSLKSLTVEEAKSRSFAYLKKSGDVDQKAFDAIWADESRTVLDRTADSLALSNTEAAAALASARDFNQPAPVELPGFLKDDKLDSFFKANVSASYGKALALKSVFEESLEALKTVQPELVVEPSTFYFHRAVAENKLIQREQAIVSIARLLDDVADAPDRYKMVATLMFFDMQQWSRDEKDLTNIGRLMDNSGRRLDIARGGPKTQDIQKKIVFRLDEAIKEIENKMKGGS